jgi:hypothetical protein
MTMRRKNKEGDWEVWQDLPTTPFSRKTKILSLLLFFFFSTLRPPRPPQSDSRMSGKEKVNKSFESRSPKK